MNIALVGFGYWGEKVYQTLSRIVLKKNIFIVDPFLKSSTKNLQIKPLKEILLNKNVEYVFIITPEETHFTIAKECLENKKNIFVEKPLCLKKVEAKELHQIAQKNNLKIYVDYIFLYDPYVKKIKEIISKGLLGKLQHIESIRHSININKPNVTVFDDLATHDIYLGIFFFEKKITNLKTIKESILSNQVNQASTTFNFGSKTLSAHYSWIQPITKRLMIFIGDKATLVWDKSEKNLLIYKNQQLTKKNYIKTFTSPLESSIRNFLYGKETYNYIKDVSILERLDNL